jgi:hypothetical protein
VTPGSRDDPSWLRPRAMSAASAPAKTTVYLGGDLLARVYDLRRQGIDINVSKVCQLALEEAIQQAERLIPPA